MASDGAIKESDVVNPINPYGRSKLMTEWMLQDVAHAHENFHTTCLRYFNVAGANMDKGLGQRGKDSLSLAMITPLQMGRVLGIIFMY